jgi:hypothetical protein
MHREFRARQTDAVALFLPVSNFVKNVERAKVNDEVMWNLCFPARANSSESLTGN